MQKQIPNAGLSITKINRNDIIPVKIVANIKRISAIFLKQATLISSFQIDLIEILLFLEDF